MPDNAALFVSVSRFAGIVSLSERTCWNLVRSLDLPVYRVGRRTLIKVEEGLRAIEKIGSGDGVGENRS